MGGHRDAAMGATWYGPAVGAFDVGRDAAAILKQNNLFASPQRTADAV
jgi:hypothetical protein